jgi:hypothetical protein
MKFAEILILLHWLTDFAEEVVAFWLIYYSTETRETVSRS